MSLLMISHVQSAISTGFQPPIENWEHLQGAVLLLILLAVGNVVLVVVALFLRRRLNDIEATRPPARKKRDETQDKQP